MTVATESSTPECNCLLYTKLMDKCHGTAAWECSTPILQVIFEGHPYLISVRPYGGIYVCHRNAMEKHSKTFGGCFFYQPGACEAQAQLCPKIAFMFSVCVCVHPQISRVLSYAICYYATIAMSAVEAIESLQAQ